MQHGSIGLGKMGRGMAKRRPTRLPASFRTLFWETSLKNIDPQQHRYYVVERLLQWGRPNHIRWMLRHYPERFILKVNHESREIRPKRKAFWSLYLSPRSKRSSYKRIKQRKYHKVNYNLIHVLNSLMYFEDAGQDVALEMIRAVEWHKVKQFFEDAVREVKL